MRKSLIAEAELSSVALVVREHMRSLQGMNAKTFAKSLGVSHGTVGNLVNMSKVHGNIVTPAIYSALVQSGLDLKKAIPELVVACRRGKDRTFTTDNSVLLRPQDPIELIHKAKELIHCANELINSKVSSWSSEIDTKKSQIAELEDLKKDLLTQKAKALDDIINEA